MYQTWYPSIRSLNDNMVKMICDCQSSVGIRGSGVTDTSVADCCSNLTLRTKITECGGVDGKRLRGIKYSIKLTR